MARQDPPHFLPGCPPDPARLNPAMAEVLVPWFRAVARDFPWRRSQDPYAIWVSEVMLQQTTTATVIPYFHRFMQAFPNVGALAAASDESVLRLWEGLGYYRRCRAMLAAARLLVAAGHSNLPDNPEILASLPGMGDYTRNAVLSQAFDRSVPIVEANSRRVLARLMGLNDDPARPPASKWLWQCATALVPENNAGAFNQALMELGGTVCLPSQPACLVCPVRPMCQAAQQGEADRIPHKTPRPAITKVESVGLALRHNNCWLLRQCPAGARREGLWEFPHEQIDDDSKPIQCAEAFLRAIVAEQQPVLSAGSHDHSITRYRVRIHLFTVDIKKGALLGEGRWIPEVEMAELPMSAPHRRIWNHLQQAPS